MKFPRYKNIMEVLPLPIQTSLPSKVAQSSAVTGAKPVKVSTESSKVESLLLTGFNIETVVSPQTNRTLLLQAASDKHWDTVEYLLSRGADGSARDSLAQTVFQYLIQPNTKLPKNAERILFQLLASHAMEINEADTNTGLRPLEAAILNRNWTIVEHLLNAGAEQINTNNLEILQIVNALGLTATHDPSLQMIFYPLVNRIARSVENSQELIDLCITNKLFHLAELFIGQMVDGIDKPNDKKALLLSYIKSQDYPGSFRVNLLKTFANLFSNNPIQMPPDVAILVDICFQNKLYDLANALITSKLKSKNKAEKIAFLKKMFSLKSINSNFKVELFLETKSIFNKKEIIQILNDIVTDYLENRKMGSSSYKENSNEKILWDMMKKIFGTNNPSQVLRRLFSLQVQPPVENLVDYLFLRIPLEERATLLEPDHYGRSIIVMAVSQRNDVFLRERLLMLILEQQSKNPTISFRSLLLTPDSSGFSALSAAMNRGDRSLVFDLTNLAMNKDINPEPPIDTILTKQDDIVHLNAKIDIYPKNNQGKTPFVYLLENETKNKEIIQEQVIFFCTQKLVTYQENFAEIMKILNHPNLNKAQKRERLQLYLTAFLSIALQIENPMQYEGIRNAVDALTNQLFLFNEFPLRQGIVSERFGRKTSLFDLFIKFFTDTLNEEIKKTKTNFSTETPAEIQLPVQEFVNLESQINSLSFLMNQFQTDHLTRLAPDSQLATDLRAMQSKIKTFQAVITGNPKFQEMNTKLEKLVRVIQLFLDNDEQFFSTANQAILA